MSRRVIKKYETKTVELSLTSGDDLGSDTKTTRLFAVIENPPIDGLKPTKDKKVIFDIDSIFLNKKARELLKELSDEIVDEIKRLEDE